MGYYVCLQQPGDIKDCDILRSALECVGFDLSAEESSVHRYHTEHLNEEECVNCSLREAQLGELDTSVIHDE